MLVNKDRQPGLARGLPDHIQSSVQSLPGSDSRQHIYARYQVIAGATDSPFLRRYDSAVSVMSSYKLRHSRAPATHSLQPRQLDFRIDKGYAASDGRQQIGIPKLTATIVENSPHFFLRSQVVGDHGGLLRVRLGRIFRSNLPTTYSVPHRFKALRWELIP